MRIFIEPAYPSVQSASMGLLHVRIPLGQI